MTIGKSKSSRLSSLNYKRDECFPIVNVPYLSNNIPESPAYGVLFHSWYVMLGFVQNMKIFCSEYLFWFKLIEAGIFFTETSDYFFENYMVIQTLLTNLTLLYNICWIVCSPTVTYDWFPVITESWLVPHVGQEMLKEHLISLSVGGSWFYPFTIYT